MKTEELWDENKNDSWVMYKKDFMFCLEEKGAGIKALVDEMIEEAKKDDFAHKQTGMLYCDKTMGKIQALTELKEKL